MVTKDFTSIFYKGFNNELGGIKISNDPILHTDE